MSLWTRWLKTRTPQARRRAAARAVRRPLGLLERLERRDVPTISLALDSGSSTYGGSVNVSIFISAGVDGTITIHDENNVEVYRQTYSTAKSTGKIVGSFAREPVGQHTMTAHFSGAGTTFDSQGQPLTINKAPLTVTANDKSKTYDRQAFNGTYTVSFSGFVLGENASVLGGAIGFTGPAVTAVNAGTYSGANGIQPFGLAADNYAITYVNGTLTINQAPLTVTGITADDKVYDGTTAATLRTDHAVLDPGGVAPGDTVVATGAAGSFADKNAGANKAVTVSSVTLGGGGSSNYVAVPKGTVTATINASVVPLVRFSVNDKEYSGTTDASVVFFQLNGDNTFRNEFFNGLVNANVTASFADPNAGAGKTVTGTLTLSGPSAGNYVASPVTATTTATIRPRPLTVSGVTADDKVYDGTAAATVHTAGAQLTGVLSGDSVAVGTGAAGSFADKNAGANKAVTVTGITLSGPAAANYTAATAAATASIKPKPLAVTGVTADDKVYDGTTAAIVHTDQAAIDATALAGGDSVSVAGAAGSFADKNAGANKAVTVTGVTLSGPAAANYAPTATGTLTASITPKTLTILSLVAANKTYDGTTAASIIDRSYSGVLVADLGQVSPSGYTSATFADRNAGTGKTVTVTGIALTGPAAGNYTPSTTTMTTTADITPRPLTVTATARDKVFDGTTVATATLADDRLTGDSLTTGYTGAAFATPDIGANKTVTVSGIAIAGGADAANYALANTTTTATASITAAAVLTPVITVADKVYDGTTAATVTGLSLAGVLPADVGNVTLTAGPASFADKNAGPGKAVTVTGLSLTGPAAFKYALAGTTAAATASIGKATLTVTADSYSRQYSDPNPGFAASITGFAGGETLATSGVTGAASAGTLATPASPPGQYAVTAGPGSLAANNYAFRFASGVLFVLPEDARASYTGATYVATNSASDGAAAVTLSANVRDASLFDAGDTTPGDVRTALVAFVNRATGQVLADNVPVTLVNANDARLGTASATVSLPVNTPASPAYLIDVRVKGSYASSPVANDGAALVEVASQAAGTASGGGTLANLRSTGQVAGDSGLATHFAFSARTGTTQSGGVSVLVRKGGGAGTNLYLITGTALQALSATANSLVLRVAGSITDVSDPAHPLLLDPSVTIRLSAQDGGAGGSADAAGVTVFKAGGDTWLNSSFLTLSATAINQALAGGNVAVVTPQRLAGPPAAGGAAPALTEAQLRPVVAAAAARWYEAWVSPAALRAALSRFVFRIDDLPGSDLGSTGDGQIRIDRDAAGHGWFVGPTPFGGELAPGVTNGRVDLLTVVAHELGHALGLDSDGGNGLMGEFLPTGVRRLPTAQEATAVSMTGAAAPVWEGRPAAPPEPVAWAAGPALVKRPRLYATLLADAAAEEQTLLG